MLLLTDMFNGSENRGVTIEIGLLDEGALEMDETLGMLREDLVTKNLSR